MLDAHGRVFGGQPLQRLAELVLVGLGVRDEGDRQQRLGHRPRLHHERVVLVAEGVAGLGARQLGDRADVAGDRSADEALGLAERRRQRADPLVLVVILVAALVAVELGEVARHVHGRIGPDRSGEDADQADASDVGVGRRLDHLGERAAPSGRTTGR